MEPFSVSLLASTSWAFATWPSTAQKVARNSLGTFYVVAVLSNDPVGYTSTNFTMFWDQGSGPVAIWTATLGTNAVCLEAFESGEVHIVYCNFTSGTLVDFCWPDVAASTTPNPATTIIGFGSAGKIGTVVDDARRCIHVIGNSNNYAKISAAGSLISQQTLFAPTSADDEVYSSLSLDDAGNLYAVIGCGTSAATPEYDVITALMSPDPGDLAPAWSAGAWGVGAALTAPINPGASGPCVQLTLGEQARRSNNLLLSATVAQGRVHVLIGETPAVSERPYQYDNFEDLTIEAVSVPWSGANALQLGNVHRPMKGATLFPKAASGGIAQRAAGLYAVLYDRTNLIALKSTDNGASWQDYAKTDMTPYLGAGAVWTPRDLTLMRGSEQDGDLVGMFTVMQCSPSTWAAAPDGFNPSASTYTFSLAAL